jgi:hypothetical protein
VLGWGKNKLMGRKDERAGEIERERERAKGKVREYYSKGKVQYG